MNLKNIWKNWKTMILWAGTILIIWCLYASYTIIAIDSNSYGKAGSFGDIFGCLTCLFTGLALAGLINNLKQQNTLLQKQNEALLLQSKALQEQSTNTALLRDTIKIQVSEHSLNVRIAWQNEIFSLINTLQTDINHLKVNYRDYEEPAQYEIQSDMVFEKIHFCAVYIVMLYSLIQCNHTEPAITKLRKALADRLFMYSLLLSRAEHILRFYEFIMRRIFDAQHISDIDKRNMYNVICARISQSEDQSLMLYLLNKNSSKHSIYNNDNHERDITENLYDCAMSLTEDTEENKRLFSSDNKPSIEIIRSNTHRFIEKIKQNRRFDHCDINEQYNIHKL